MRQLASLVLVLFAATAQAREFRAADIQPDDYPTVLAVRYMSDIIKQKTGGKDSIKVFSGGALGGEKDTI
ncbi:MAG TPA: TRAP transporter substrate-binding protein, partial [Stellaceae bacterium]|nr:TRAP transporter substrate-binding protein [Stellaceae bacterium]